MIRATFAEGVDVVTAHGLTQWDYGQTLEIDGLSLPASFQVHFACKRATEAIVRLATTVGGVSSTVIPDVLLEQDTELRAWIYIVGDGTGETIKLIRIPIQARLKPQDFISQITPSQQTMLEEFMSRLNDLADDIETSNEQMSTALNAHLNNTDNPHNVTFDQITGVLPVTNGGTGATSASEARENLGVNLENLGAASDTHTHGLATTRITGVLPVSKGGTGSGTAAEARENLEITPSNIGAAPKSHNHSMDDITSGTLPISKGGTGATTASDARTNLEITPSNIGAAPKSHNQAASTITGGIFPAYVKANAAAQTNLTNNQVRNIQASTTDLTAGTSELATGEVYLVYE